MTQKSKVIQFHDPNLTSAINKLVSQLANRDKQIENTINTLLQTQDQIIMRINAIERGEKQEPLPWERR